MEISLDFYTYAKWSGILTLVCLVIAGLGFIFKWGIRFRLVGVTGFMGVLTVGLFALGLGLFSHTVIPGSVRFSVVYDNGANQAVIAVTPEITKSELEATLRQAAADLYSSGRLGGSSDRLTIRARTIVHPEPGLSQPLYLGQVRRSLSDRNDDELALEIFSESFAQLAESTS
ncbi:MAG: Ycf51 family protein [Oscillatoria sp. PMC 1051.18]|nr:Ycf51 family protein [Oscillatoria sp. PMC 1050.18]MEC5029350.1 Ycf51 family protein [Oscillatoria sp. PMC 1051.18]